MELLRSCQPVLELGPGRGELLEALRDAGIQARGVDSEAPMVSVCRRHGLDVSQGDALQHLEGLAAGSLGAVVAIHVLEHLAPAAWMRVIDESSRVAQARRHAHRGVPEPRDTAGRRQPVLDRPDPSRPVHARRSSSPRGRSGSRWCRRVSCDRFQPTRRSRARVSRRRCSSLRRASTRGCPAHATSSSSRESRCREAAGRGQAEAHGRATRPPRAPEAPSRFAGRS